MPEQKQQTDFEGGDDDAWVAAMEAEGALLRAAPAPRVAPWARSNVVPLPERKRPASADELQRIADAPPEAVDPDAAGAALIKATPYQFRDPSSIPPRQWLYGRHLVRKFVSATVAPGGAGKTFLTVAEALALVTGRDLLGKPVYGGPKSVWLFNLEDPAEELWRRIEAARFHYGLSPGEGAGRLFVDSGRQTPLYVARQAPRTGFAIVVPMLEAMVREIRQNKIDVLIIDPFVSSHRVSENDNMAIDAVVKQWGAVAEVTNCAVELVHHTRKTGGEDATAEDMRGASSQIGAVRDVRVLNRMKAEDAAKYGIAPEDCRRFFRVESDKANLAPRGSADWYTLVSVNLGNGHSEWPEGDDMGVAVPWVAPSPLEGINKADVLSVQQAIAASPQRARADMRSADWVGHLVGEVLGIAMADAGGTKDKAACRRVAGMLEIWIKNGALKKELGTDNRRNEREFVVVGAWVDEDE